jgi:hypothetical protein
VKRHGLILAAALLLAAAAPPGAATLESAQAALIRALQSHGVFVPGRQLLSVTYACSVSVNGETMPVVEILEQVPEAMQPRGVARVELLSASLAPIKELPVDAGVRPLFCVGNSVYFSGDVKIDNIYPGGNKVTFSLGGEYAQVAEIDAAKSPAPLEH